MKVDLKVRADGSDESAYTRFSPRAGAVLGAAYTTAKHDIPDNSGYSGRTPALERICAENL